MEKNIKSTQLSASNPSIVSVNGVIYFKFNSGFEGDYTKGCGLTGQEVDQNFYFLRGYDIKSVEMDEEKNLIIKRVNPDYDPIVIKIGEELGQPTFEYDPKEGVLTVLYPDGSIEILDGFMVPGKDITVATDGTINGDGTIYNPLRLSNMEKTGTFAPAAEYLDLTEGEEMPDGKEKGYRIVTKEKVDNFGKLYPFGALEIIQQSLDNASSEWRVPTKEDWDDLFNALECEEYRNHSGMTVGDYGDIAGDAVKSAVDLWINSGAGCDAVGFRALPLGNCTQRSAMMDDPDYDAEGLGKFASFWTNTQDSVGNAYAKSMWYHSNQIKQESKGAAARLSIRLVKDYNYGNFNQYEDILGLNYETVLIRGPHDDYDYIKVWTVQNFYDPSDILSGVTSYEWSAATEDLRQEKDAFFINEWDGYHWEKKMMKDGESIVIAEYEDAPYHEWRVIDGELIDTVQALKDEIKEELDEIEQRIDNIDTEINEINENLNELSASTTENVERIDNTINEFSASTVSEIERIDSELVRLDGNDIVPGTYTLNGDSDSEMEIPTKGESVENLKIKVSDDFFGFGTF